VGIVQVSVELWPNEVCDRDKVVYSVSPINGWPDRKNKPGVETVSPNVHRPPTRTMARIAGYG